MPSPPPGFRAALAALSPERFAAFIADLWRARGRSVERDGRRLAVTKPGPTGETVVCPVPAGEPGPIPDRVDTVVHAGGEPPVGLPPDTTVLGPADIYERLRYAIDRADADPLVTTYLDESVFPGSPSPRSLVPAEADDEAEAKTTEAAERDGASGETDERDGPSGEADERDGASGETDERGVASVEADTALPTITGTEAPTDGTGRRFARRSLLVGAGGFLAGLGAAAAIGALESPADRSTDPGPTAESATLQQPAGIPVPGLSRDGVTGPRTLAVGHIDRLQDRSFTIDSTKTIHAADGRLLSSLSLSVRLATSRSFRVSIATGGPQARPLFGESDARVELWSDRDTYLRKVTADGETRYTEYGARVTVNDWYFWSNIIPFGGPPYATLEFYRDLFELVPVAVASRDGDGEAPYVLTAVDQRIESSPLLLDSLDTASTIRDFDTSALVTAPGLIRSTRLAYAGPRNEKPVSVRWSIDYREVGETSVERPAWADRALE